MTGEEPVAGTVAGDAAQVAADGTGHGVAGTGATRRDRASLRRSATPKRGRGRVVASVVGSVVWEVIGEIVFFALVVLVSWLVYEELRWPFILVVFLSVNAVLALIALAVWLRRRRTRGRTRRRSRDSVDRSGSGPDSEAAGDAVRNRTGR